MGRDRASPRGVRSSAVRAQMSRGREVSGKHDAGSEQIPGYALLGLLGEGGMGVVYRARDLRTGREVALKRLRMSGDLEQARRRFRREFRAAARLRHTHVASVYDYHPGTPLFYTMELVRGIALDRALDPGDGARADPDRVGRLRDLVGQVLVALDAVHGAGLVHRDLKPQNVLVTEIEGEELPFEPPAGAVGCYRAHAGCRRIIKLVDFGLAWLGDHSGDLTKTGTIVGTVDYISPEQVLGATTDGRADLYSLGVMTYELLVGRPPFEAPDTISLVLKHAYEAPPPPSLFDPDVDPRLAAWVMRLLSKEPADRFPSAIAALDALTGDRSGPGVVSATSSAMLAERVTGLLPSRLVGRDREIARLRRVVDGAASGRPAHVVVRGEAGIGKSRLLEELQKETRRRGLLTLTGIAHDEQGFALAPVLPLLDALASELTAQDREAVGPAAAVLARLVPRFGDVVAGPVVEGPPASAEEERLQIFGAVWEVIQRVCARRPLALILEDVHWADPSSIALLSYLARAVETTPHLGLLIASSLRDEEVELGSALARWREALARSPVSHEIGLGRLEADELEEMARTMLGVEVLPAPVLRWLVRESQGVPFIAGELLAAFAADGAGRVVDGSVRLRRELSGEFAFPRELPATVGDLVRRRLSKLDRTERRVAATAALIGHEVPFDLLAAGTGMDEDELLDAVQALLVRRILVESRDENDLFLFPAKVARDVLVGEMFQRRRRLIHERVAACIEGRDRSRPEEVVRRAHHWLMADREDRALAPLLESVVLHRRRGLDEQALGAARRALEIVETTPALAGPATRLRLLLDVGELEAAHCHYERAGAAFTRLEVEAREMHEADLHAGALLGLADLDLRRGDYDLAAQRAQGALGDVASADSGGHTGRAHTALGRIAWHRGRLVAAASEFTAALAVAHRTGDRAAEATALNNLGYAHFGRGRYSEAEHHFEASLRIARSLDHRLAVARGLEASASVAQRRADYDGGRAAAIEAMAIMQRLGDRRGEAYCRVSLANLSAFGGDWLEALQVYDAAEAIFVELGEARGVAFCAANRGRVLTSLGAFAEALEALGQAFKLPRRIDEQSEVAACQYAFAELWREVGDWAEAARHDRRAVAALEELEDGYGLGLALAGRAETRAARGDRDGARDDVDRALTLALEGGLSEVEVRARTCRARLADDADEAAAAAAQALAVGLRELAAHAFALEAELRADDAGATTSARDRAVELFEELGATLGERRAGFLARPSVVRALGHKAGQVVRG